MQGNSLLRMLLIAGAAVAGVFLIPKLLGTDKAGETFTFKETYPEAVEKLGEDAKIVAVTSNTAFVGYDVVGEDGQIKTLSYTVETSETRGPQGQPAQGRDRKTVEGTRAPRPGEVENATITLGQLDEEVVERMFEELDFDPSSMATLSGQEWTLSSGLRTFDRFKANFDGTNIHQTQSKEDVFGTPGAPVAPPVPAQ